MDVRVERSGGQEATGTTTLREDGTIVGSITNTFVDEDGGFTGRLSVTLPITCGSPVIEHHLQRFAVEVRNWIHTAAAALDTKQPQIRPAREISLTSPEVRSKPDAVKAACPVR